LETALEGREFFRHLLDELGGLLELPDNLLAFGGDPA
jgi:hypothetical protein